MVIFSLGFLKINLAQIFQSLKKASVMEKRKTPQFLTWRALSWSETFAIWVLFSGFSQKKMMVISLTLSLPIPVKKMT